jgi:Holliday junction DNA helicase RuvA
VIASVRGDVVDIALDHAVIECAGVGYKVMCTPSTLAGLRRGTEARRVSGVGPKIARATWGVYAAAALRQALADGDVTALTRVPGIGKRSAERLVLELRDKIGAVAGPAGSTVAGGHAVRGPVVEALVGLGFPQKQAEEATDKVLAAESDASTSTVLRSALNLLGKTK